MQRKFKLGRRALAWLMMAVAPTACVVLPACGKSGPSIEEPDDVKEFSKTENAGTPDDIIGKGEDAGENIDQNEGDEEGGAGEGE